VCVCVCVFRFARSDFHGQILSRIYFRNNRSPTHDTSRKHCRGPRLSRSAHSSPSSFLSFRFLFLRLCFTSEINYRKKRDLCRVPIRHYSLSLTNESDSGTLLREENVGGVIDTFCALFAGYFDERFFLMNEEPVLGSGFESAHSSSRYFAKISRGRGFPRENVPPALSSPANLWVSRPAATSRGQVLPFSPFLSPCLSLVETFSSDSS